MHHPTINLALPNPTLPASLAFNRLPSQEPAFAPQIVKQLSNTGELELGPFAVAVLADLN